MLMGLKVNQDGDKEANFHCQHMWVKNMELTSSFSIFDFRFSLVTPSWLERGAMRRLDNRSPD